MKTRIISGAVLTMVTVAMLLCGGYLLFGVCLLISLIGMYELYRIINMQFHAIAIGGYLSAVVYYVLVMLDKQQYNTLVFIAFLLYLMTVYVLTFPKYDSNQIMLCFTGLIYVAVMLSYIYQVRIMDGGIYLVWLIFVTSWGNDTFAYFTGVLLGKHKMAPKLSPKKSIEGAIGGVLGATILGVIYGIIVNSCDPLIGFNAIIVFTIAAFIGALFAIVGDLAASAIKRNHNVKDYGNIIPGHGGILDRYDSVIFTAPAVYWAVLFVNMFIM